MTTTRRVLTGLAAAGLVISALGAGSASAATKGKIYISNNCGKAVSTTIHRTDGSTIAGTAAAPAGSYFGYPVYPGKYQVRVPMRQTRRDDPRPRQQGALGHRQGLLTFA